MFIYRLFLNFAAFPLGLLLMIRYLKGTEDWTDFWQRFGKPVAMKRPEQKWLWVHAASNGELQSAKPVLDALAARYSQTSLLITCNSLSGRLWAKELGYHVVLSPLDLRWAQRRFMSAYPIAAHVTFEAELWPNRIAILAAADIPIAAFGARMSARGQTLWRRFPRLSAKLLNALAYLQPQDADSDQRFKSLGIDPRKMGPVLNWKSLYQPQTIDLDSTKRRNICLAASTHPGEDEIILKAFGLVRQTWPELQLIVAPRHPKRGAEIADLILSQGWRLQRYSQDQASGPEKVDVILADTLGEMPKWYAASGLCIVGGAFKNHGGHTPYEPAAYGCALITGTHTHNFSAEYETLAQNKAAIRATDAEALSKALLSLKTPSAQQNLAQRATKALSHGVDISVIMDELEHLVPISNTDLT